MRPVASVGGALTHDSAHQPCAKNASQSLSVLSATFDPRTVPLTSITALIKGGRSQSFSFEIYTEVRARDRDAGPTFRRGANAGKLGEA